MATILITGITGAVMAPLSALLLERGHSVVALIRPKAGMTPKERLQEVGIAKNTRERLLALPGDILEPLAGVREQDLNFWRGRIDAVAHGAGLTKFKESPAQEIHLANVGGTREMLRLATALKIPKFYHMSTIFVGGDVPEFLETDIPQGSGRNAYEHSKIKAEALVRNSLIPASICRLPIVVGDSKTGETSSFTGYYECAEPFWRLRQAILQRWTKDKERCQQDGIQVNKEGDIHVSLRVPCSAAGPLHVVPRDWVTRVLADLLEIPVQDKTLHLVHPTPPRVSDAFAAGLRFLGFTGITCGKRQETQEDSCTSPFINTLQKMIERSLNSYAPYISRDEQRFGDSVLREVLKEHGKTYHEPPVLDSQFFECLLAFATKRNFTSS